MPSSLCLFLLVLVSFRDRADLRSSGAVAGGAATVFAGGRDSALYESS